MLRGSNQLRPLNLIWVMPAEEMLSFEGYLYSGGSRFLFN